MILLKRNRKFRQNNNHINFMIEEGYKKGLKERAEKFRKMRSEQQVMYDEFIDEEVKYINEVD